MRVCACVFPKDLRDLRGPLVIRDQEPRERKGTLGSRVSFRSAFAMVSKGSAGGEQVVSSSDCRFSWRERRPRDPRRARYLRGDT